MIASAALLIQPRCVLVSVRLPLCPCPLFCSGLCSALLTVMLPNARNKSFIAASSRRRGQPIVLLTVLAAFTGSCEFYLVGVFASPLAAVLFAALLLAPVSSCVSAVAAASSTPGAVSLASSGTICTLPSLSPHSLRKASMFLWAAASRGHCEKKEQGHDKHSK